VAEHGSARAIVAALLANVGIAVAKLTAFVFTGAASMLAESIHSVADSSNQLLLLFGRRRSLREPTESHPFGFARERYFWAFAVSVVLFAVGGLFSVYEGVDKLRHPHEIESIWWAAGVLTIALVMESLSLRTAVRASRPSKMRRSWWTFVRTAKEPELPVVLLEDIGALVGLALALVGVTTAELTGNARFDAAGSLGIGLLLMAISAVLAVEMKGLLIGEAAAPHEIDAMRDAITTSAHVRRLLDLKTQHLGPDELLVGVKVELAQELTADEVADAINAIEANVRRRVPAARHLYIEPDVS
jgi:cation diffusion facilitator family transporter